MEPAKLSAYEWSWLSPNRRDYVRLGLLNYGPPSEYSPVLETEDGWLIAIERERRAAALEARFANLYRSASHDAKGIELTNQMEMSQGGMVNINKTGSCIKKSLTRNIGHEIKRLVRYVLYSHTLWPHY
jgi:hypothetical protein